MRLIDADKLIEVMKNDDAFDSYELEMILENIKNSPTAYDIDKVVEALENEQNKLDTNIFARETNDWYGEYCNGISDGIERAIEIVKQGLKEQK